MQKDPVCGMNVDSNRAAEKSDYNGFTYCFCSQACKRKFDQSPAQCIKS